MQRAREDTTVARDALRQEIVTALTALGVSPVVGEGADITLDWEFLDAKWGSGEKKIEFHNSAFLDEDKQTLYYWESTKETGSGLSFGGSSESFSQSGTTLMRKVKSIQYGPDGKAYEYDLDLGQIVNTYKSAAKSAGWKLKVVLSRDKARYPAGFVAASPIPTGPAPIPVTPPAPAPAVITPVPPVPAPIPAVAPAPTVPPVPSATPAAAPAVTFPAPSAGRPIAPSPAKPKGGLGDTIKKVGIGIAIGVVVIIGLLYWIGSSVDGDDPGSGGSSSTGAVGEVTEESSRYRYGGYDLTLMLAGEDDYTPDSYTHNLGLLGSVFQDIYFEDSDEDPEGSKVVSLKVSNFELVDGPAKGTFAGIESGSIADMAGQPIQGAVDGTTVTIDTTQMSSANSGWSNTVYLSFRVKDVATYTYPSDYSGAMSYDTSYRQLGIPSEDLLFAVAYDLEIKTADGKVYRTHVQTDRLSGDVVNEPSTAVGTRTFETNEWDAFGE